MASQGPSTRNISEGVRARHAYPPTSAVHAAAAGQYTVVTPAYIHRYLRSLGITEQVFIHEQDYFQFLEEKGLTELGRGGEGTVYFLRGHVVKVINPEAAAGSLREIAHMLHLNRHVGGGTMGERTRADWPSLLWIYVLSNGALSIGMKPFDTYDIPGSTLFDRLTFGPEMGRQQVLAMIKGISSSLVHAHRCGLIHHDLKPANIYVPGHAAEPPVVFDLGQALWQQTSWGRNWLRHEHNNLYWYNGTYRYMHHQRRLAHMAALARARGEAATPPQEAAFGAYLPAFMDDVIAFARILRDIVQSQHVQLTEPDRTLLRRFYQGIMGLKKVRGRKPGSHPVIKALERTGSFPTLKSVSAGKSGTNPGVLESGIFRRLTLGFLAPEKLAPEKSAERPAVDATTRSVTMEQIHSEVERILSEMAAPPAAVVAPKATLSAPRLAAVPKPHSSSHLPAAPVPTPAPAPAPAAPAPAPAPAAPSSDGAKRKWIKFEL